MREKKKEKKKAKKKKRKKKKEKKKEEEVVRRRRNYLKKSKNQNFQTLELTKLANPPPPAKKNPRRIRDGGQVMTEFLQKKINFPLLLT